MGPTGHSADEGNERKKRRVVKKKKKQSGKRRVMSVDVCVNIKVSLDILLKACYILLSKETSIES